MSNETKQYRSQNQTLNYEQYFEVPEGESQTIPDQSLSTRDILHRYTSGQSLDINANTPVYLENVKLYDSRRKNNIDLAVDKMENEREILRLDKKAFDEKTKMEALLNQQKNVKNVQKIQPSDAQPFTNPATES